MHKSFSRLFAVTKRTGLSRSTIYLRMSQDRFPKPVNLGGRAVAWIDSEIDDWMEKQIETSRRVGE